MEGTVSAGDWISRSSISDEVHARWPGYRAILIATDDVDVDRLAAAADSLFDESHAAARAAAEPDEHTLAWHQAYRDFGVKPRVARVSVDALVRRAATDSGLPRINTLVDVYNAISILHRVPIGGEDLDRYDGPARLILAAGTEPFHTTADGEPVVSAPDRGEPIWVDGTGVTCRRWNWRQTSRTAITPATGRAAFIVDSLDTPDHRGAHAAAEQLAGLLPNSVSRTITGR